MRRYWLSLLCMLAWVTAPAAPLQSFTVTEYLNRTWTDEVVHFDFAVPSTAKNFHLTAENGTPVLAQVSDLTVREGTARGTIWTVLTLEPNARITLHLHAGAPKTLPPSGVSLTRSDGMLVLRNARMRVALPALPGALPHPAPLAKQPAPLRGIASAEGGDWLGAQHWTAPEALLVREAATTVIEDGPVRVTVQQRYTFADGSHYTMQLSLADRQEVALVTEDSTLAGPKASYRLSWQEGLKADQILWYDSYYANVNRGQNRNLLRCNFEMGERDRVVFQMKPWSFWWEEERAQYAGFASELSPWMTSVQMIRPSRWSPYAWDGHAHTAVPVAVGGHGRMEMTFTLNGLTRKKEDGTESFAPLHREWTLAVDRAAELLTEAKVPVFRKRLLKYSEFPLDEIKDYGFDFTPANPKQQHPYLFFNAEEVARARRQALTDPLVQAEAAKATVPGLDTIRNGGREAFYQNYFVAQNLIERLPTAYLSRDDRLIDEALAAAVLGLKQEVVNTFINTPVRPSLGGYGPWFTDHILRLVKLHDLVAGRSILTPDEEASVRASLVFCAHLLDHPDYWNTTRGLCSANPNMTNSIVLPKGILGLYLQGHPKTDQWLRDAEAEMQYELKHWVKPGGAWEESPGYQSASMDALFLLAAAFKSITGKDYFADTQFRDLMDYYGFLLTPPDLRFPPRKAPNAPSPMVLPSVGDTFAGFITCYNGWMATATAKTDPAYSARQQFFWKSQGAYYGSAGRATGLQLALLDPSLPAVPPDETSKSFPGYGNILRTSWTDPRATYVSHRTGGTYHHYHADYGSLVLYAKGAPLCTDFGNLYEPARRDESRFHSMVHLGDTSAGSGGVTDFASLRRTIDYSAGRAHIGGGTMSARHILLVKSDDALGANYVVLRDRTAEGKADQPITWSLWCLAKPWEDPTAPAVDDDKLFADFDKQPVDYPKDRIHFTGQFGVDLDVYILSPRVPKIERDKNWAWTQQIYVWGAFKEEQSAGRIVKQGHAEDFFTILYPRAKGQAEAAWTALADRKGAKIAHMEGTDYLLFSPGVAATVTAEGATLTGEIAYARRYTGGAVRLAVVRGKEASAALDGWTLRSSGPASLSINGATISGEASGDAHAVHITLPPALGAVRVQLDGAPLPVTVEKATLTLPMPEGYHTFTITPIK